MSELARAVLGALILAPSLLESEDLEAADFSAGRERETFVAISTIWEEDKPTEIPLPLLSEKLHGNGVAAFASSLLDGAIRPNPDNFRMMAEELRRQRLSIDIVRTAESLGREHEKTGFFDKKGFEHLAALIEGQRENRGGVNVHEQLISGAALRVLQVESEWTVEKVVPCRSITLLHSPGGLGKTWFSLGMANAVSQGMPFLGLETKQRMVCYIDFENPLPLLIDRAIKLDIKEVQFWHLSAKVPPPKLDTPAHKLYRQLPAGSLIIFDTLRAAHDSDENSSQDMARIMGRLKGLRELGFDIFLIHHTGKANERQYKGSTAISDLADHVLKFYKARKGSLEEVLDDIEPDQDASFVLATGKTRFEPFHLFLSFKPDAGGFSVAEDPNLEALEALANYIAGRGLGQNQTEIIEWAKDSLGVGRKQRLIALLNRGEREGRWRTRRGIKGAKLYEPKS
jgi:hypothetical protein